MINNLSKSNIVQYINQNIRDTKNSQKKKRKPDQHNKTGVRCFPKNTKNSRIDESGSRSGNSRFSRHFPIFSRASKVSLFISTEAFIFFAAINKGGRIKAGFESVRLSKVSLFIYLYAGRTYFYFIFGLLGVVPFMGVVILDENVFDNSLS